jgi:hypothetical protein
MDFKTFLNSHWERFLTHICQYYPLSESFIDHYQEDLNWRSLSESKVIKWNAELIKKYESKISWAFLAMNSSILWDEQMLSQFKKHLDFYYLVRNPNLPISEEFVTKHLKQLHFTEQNVHLTPALREKYKDRLLPASKLSEHKFTKDDLQNLMTYLNNWPVHYDTAKDFYDLYIHPNLERYPLEKIFKDKFDYSQRYYFMSALNNDRHGMTPGYKGDSANPFQTYDHFGKLLDIPPSQILEFIPDPGSEGPDRIFEVLRSSRLGMYAALLVSENIKNILEKFTLPTHQFCKAAVTAKKIKVTSPFYTLQFELHTIYRDLEFSKTSFVYRTKKMSNRTGWENVERKLRSLQDVVETKNVIRDSFNDIGTFVEILPVQFPLSTSFDIYTLDNRIIVNEFVKEAIESQYPGQVKFDSAQSLKISINQQVYHSKRLTYKPGQHVTTGSPIGELTEDESYFRGKKQRLEETSAKLERSLPNDLFRQIQIRLNVVIPDHFKIFYSNNKRLGAYDLLPIDKFYIQDQFDKTYPESYKSLVVGENGVGDSIGLILEKQDDFMLQPVIFEFLHETADMEKYEHQIEL